MINAAGIGLAVGQVDRLAAQGKTRLQIL